ncbi:MAG: 6,7-dimethyl-8-ribityllumazine synthase [Chloroflexota bacterium]|nr:6,7-dimethyl-8-ribityllumazine synthase [Chloroflexota bacterium]
MGRELQGELTGRGLRFGIVVARFNELVTRMLLDGARDGLVRHGVSPDDVDVAWVPGSFEIPLAAQHMAAGGSFAGIICLGAIIRGETDHYDHVAAGVTSGVARVALDTGVPTIFGVLTTDTVEQALNRAGLKAGNKGYEAAVTAVEMASLLRQLEPAALRA